MKFLFASDSFKGTLTSRRTAELLTEAAREIFPSCECVGVEMADGGEGTTEAVIAAAGGSRIEARVHGRSGTYGQAVTGSSMTGERLWRWRQHPV